MPYRAIILYLVINVFCGLQSTLPLVCPRCRLSSAAIKALMPSINIQFTGNNVFLNVAPSTYTFDTRVRAHPSLPGLIWPGISLDRALTLCHS